MSVSVNIHASHHGNAKIKAIAGLTQSYPLTLEIRDAKGNRCGEVSIFTGSLALTCAIADAINAAAAPPVLTEAAA